MKILEIILVRHGKAQDQAYGLADEDRELTEEGKIRFKKQIKPLIKKLDTNKNIVIWTSPALRASQTAEIIEDELETNNLFVHDFIYTGNYNSFLFELENIEDNTTLFVVGHEPHLSIWANMIDGEYHRFKKGTMISFAVTNNVPLEAKEQWIINPIK